jgi:hypothetical protein
MKGMMSKFGFGVNTPTLAPKLAVVKQEAGASYNLTEDDNNCIIEFTNVGAVSIYVMAGLSVGFQCTVVNYGGATKTLIAGAGCTLLSKDAKLALASQYGAATTYHRGSNVFLAFGDLT